MKVPKMVDGKNKLVIEPTKPLRNILDVPVEEYLRASKVTIKKGD